jgi:N-acetylmuramoyl-L-alanine amidase
VKTTATVISFLLIIVVALNAIAQGTPLVVYNSDGDEIGTLKVLDNQGAKYVLLEEISKLFGGTRQNQPLLGRVTLIMKENRIVVTVNQNKIKINDDEFTFTKPSVNISGKTAVPVDFLTRILSRVLGKRIVLDQEQWTLDVTDGSFDRRAQHEADLGIPIKTYNPTFRVMIDPGHGGFDSGVRGKDNILEKDLTLEVSQKIKELLVGKEGIEVFLTRNDDRYMTPEERVNFANNLRGNVLLSIHFNWSPSPNSKGFSVCINSDRIRMAPEASTASISGGDAFTGYSKKFANEIRSRLTSVITTGGKEKEAPLTITNGLFMPCVLLEVLYLSNQKDLDILSKSEFVNTVATSLSDSILAFNRAVTAQKDSTE